MKKVSSQQFPQRDKAGLESFFKYCHSEACREGRAKYASISLRVKHIDPLAVLDSIYESGEKHFYIENSQRDEALAGAEAIELCEASGVNRLAEVQAFCDAILADTLAIGDLEAPFAGPHFLGGCGFLAETDAVATPSFAPATFFLPRWQVGCSGGEYTAVANCKVEPDSDVPLLVEKVWAAHQKFYAFEYPTLAPQLDAVSHSVTVTEVGGEAWFEAGVQEAIEEIAAERYQKIVLARALEMTREDGFQPLEALNLLRAQYPSCYAFSLANGCGESFIGATPERLLRVEKGQLLTEALAGSAARGASAQDDARCSRALLGSDKDQREHAFVIQSIARRLEALGIVLDEQKPARLLKLQNVQHLKTSLQAALPEGVSFLDVLNALHPTPAVGGLPREVTTPRIVELEPFERGMYAGVVGWFDGEGKGEMVVGIRSALVGEQCARVYAGVGIVEGSDPAREKQETDWKFRPMLDILKA